MAKSIQIRMMGEFVISINEKEIASLSGKSRKGVSLMEYLILNNQKPVPKQRLLNTLWSDYIHTNPESALKTLVSRLRKLLNDQMPGLGDCIGSERGAYYWNPLPGMKVDVLQIMSLFEKLPHISEIPVRKELSEQLLALYQGDLFLTGDIEGGAGYSAALHNEYLEAVYNYIDFLKKEEAYLDITRVCHKALMIDELDDRLHLELMQAQFYMNRKNDAIEQYKRVANLNRRYLDADPSEEMQSFYQKMVRSRTSLKVNLDSIRAELLRDEPRGALVCDYHQFREICNLQRSTMSRLGHTVFLGLIMLYEADAEIEPGSRQFVSEEQEMMDALMDITKDNLRNSDVIMRYQQNILAVLLPTVDHTTGNLVMERIRHLFFERFPSSRIPFFYRLGELR